jgi:hypothetical protein
MRPALQPFENLLWLAQYCLIFFDSSEFVPRERAGYHCTRASLVGCLDEQQASDRHASVGRGAERGYELRGRAGLQMVCFGLGLVEVVRLDCLLGRLEPLLHLCVCEGSLGAQQEPFPPRARLAARAADPAQLAGAELPRAPALLPDGAGPRRPTSKPCASWPATRS